MRSPWQRELGDRIEELVPALRAYFGAIPVGSLGRGDGVFTVVGTPRRWLWPVFALLAWDGVIFPVWEHDVPFTITNRSTPRGTVRSTRVFRLAGGDRVMVDEVGMTASGLVDRLGRHGAISVRLTADVVDGNLVLRSSGASLFSLPLGPFSPRLSLIESRDGDRQHVSVALDAPLLGRLYEYSGSFDYAVESEADRG